jgi:quinol monooxygenase YgiN
MPITELALLRLSPGITIENPTLRSNLSHAKTIMQNYTGHTFYYMQQSADPAYIYIIGEWDSLAQHLNDFIPGRDNQVVLEGLAGLLTVPRLEHIDVSHAELPLPRSDRERETALRGELVWSIGRYFVRRGEKAAFQEAFEDEKQGLQDFVTGGRVGGGWRVDGEEEKEEFVLLSSWKSVGQYGEFGETEGFREYGRVGEFVDGADIKHVRLLDI